MAYIGLLPPGMLNMTTVRTTIEKGSRAGLLFALGAASVVLIQASVALIGANYLNKNPEVIESLKVAGVVVFMLLAIFFFIQARKKFKAEGKEKQGNFFFTGLFMSSINMLAIPFYFGWSAVFSAKGWLIMEQPYILIFVIGAMLGAFALLLTYSGFANVIVKRAQFIARNINYILSVVFVFLGISTLLNVLNIW